MWQRFEGGLYVQIVEHLNMQIERTTKVNEVFLGKTLRLQNAYHKRAFL